jgi:hypothetical protein
MTPPFTVRSPGPYEHHFRKLLKRHPDLVALQERAVEILEQDPYNRSGQYNIKKLMDVPQPSERALTLNGVQAAESFRALPDGAFLYMLK